MLVAFAACTFLFHVVVNAMTPYGFHRDEFLYLAMGRHLDLFRMDFPPFIALLAEAQRFLFGDSLVGIRLAPALAGAVIVGMAGLIARTLGGGRYAQALAMLCVLVNMLFLRAANLFQPVVFDQLWWTLGYFALVRLVSDRRPGWWLLLGVATGLGLLTKFSILFFGAGVAVALLVTPLRTALRTRWPWVAVAIAFAIGAPSIAGQVALDWPLRLQMEGLREAQLDRVTAGDFLGQQLMFGMGTVVAIAGLASLIGGSLRTWRVIGVATLTSFLLLLVTHGKSYYAGPIYPALFAAGAVVVESAARARAAVASRWAVAGGVAFFGVLTLPMGVPILPPSTMTSYAARLGITSAVRTNRGELLELPQDYADMLGWEEQSIAVARVYRDLSPAEQAETVVIGGNYGEAGALDFFGPRYGLPPAISTAGTYWQFGPGPKPGRVLLALGIPAADLSAYYDSVTTVGRVRGRWAVPEERDVPITLARAPHGTLQSVWGRVGPNYQ